MSDICSSKGVCKKQPNQPTFRTVSEQKKPRFATVTEHKAPAPLNDENLVLSIIPKKSHLMASVSATLKDNKRFAMKAIEVNPFVLRHLSARLRNDPEIVRKAVSRDADAFAGAGDKIKNNERFVLGLLKDHTRWEPIYEHASDVVKTRPQALDLLFSRSSNKRVWLDKTLAMIPGNKDGSDWFWSKCFKANFNVYDKMPDHLQARFTKEYKKITGDLKKLGITVPKRMTSTSVAFEIINNRKNLSKKSDKPLAVIIYGRSDWNKALLKNKIAELIEKGYKVAYFEVENEDEFYSSFKSATTGQAANLLVVGGHGTKDGLELGGKSEKQMLDLSDRRELNRLGLKDRLETGASIILESCSTGKGKDETYNFVNMLRLVVGQEIDLFAPAGDSGVLDYRYDSSRNNKVIGVKYNDADTYSIGSTR